MTTSAFASLMAIAISQFTGTAPAPSHSPSIHQSAAMIPVAPVQQHAQTAPTSRATSVRSSYVFVPAEQVPPVTPAQFPISNTAKATDSDTLNSIELGPDQLAQLGVELPENGDIVVYYPNHRGDSRSWRFSTNGSMSQGLTGPPTAGIKVEPLPYAITYPLGEALMYTNFKGAGGVPDQLIGVEPKTAQKYSSLYARLRGESPSATNTFSIHTESERKDPGHSTHTKMMAVIKSDTNGASTPLIVAGGDNNTAMELPLPRRGVSVPLHWNRSDSTHREVRSVIVQSRIMVDTASGGQEWPPMPLVDTASGGQQWPPMPLFDSSGQSFMFQNESGTDGAVEMQANGRRMMIRSAIVDTSSGWPSWMRSGDSVALTVKKLTSRLLNTDSVIIMPGLVSSRVLRNTIGDSTNLRMLLQQLKCDTAANALPGIHVGIAIPGSATVRGSKSDTPFEQYYRSRSGDTTRWSSLIPIRVTNYNTPEHHTLIFWYTRTPEVLNLLPRSAVEKADARPKNLEISVYPNPTSGETNVHYIVKNGEPVTINVVNLLGQKLIDGGARQDQHGDLSLNLSSLEPGVYLLIATLQNGEKAVERVVVTK